MSKIKELWIEATVTFENGEKARFYVSESGAASSDGTRDEKAAMVDVRDAVAQAVYEHVEAGGECETDGCYERPEEGWDDGGALCADCRANIEAAAAAAERRVGA